MILLAFFLVVTINLWYVLKREWEDKRKGDWTKVSIFWPHFSLISTLSSSSSYLNHEIKTYTCEIARLSLCSLITLLYTLVNDSISSIKLELANKYILSTISRADCVIYLFHNLKNQNENQFSLFIFLCLLYFEGYTFHWDQLRGTFWDRFSEFLVRMK